MDDVLFGLKDIVIWDAKTNNRWSSKGYDVFNDATKVYSNLSSTTRIANCSMSTTSNLQSYKDCQSSPKVLSNNLQSCTES